MKLTKSKLKQLIKEELAQLKEARGPTTCEGAQQLYTNTLDALANLYDREEAQLHLDTLKALEAEWPDCNFTITVGDNLGPPRPETEEEAEGPPLEEPRPKYTGPQRW